MSMRYFKRNGETLEHIECDVVTPRGQTQALIGVEKLLCSARSFCCMNGCNYELSDTERLEALELVNTERNKVKCSGEIKTIDGWHSSGFGDFHDYFNIGDEVDQDVIDHFTDVLPPRSISAGYLQVGEPYSQEIDENGRYRATWATFLRKDGRWYYVGECFSGETNSRVIPPTRAERMIGYLKREA